VTSACRRAEKAFRGTRQGQPLSGDSLLVAGCPGAAGAYGPRASFTRLLRLAGVATVANQPIEEAAALDALDGKPDAEKNLLRSFNVATARS